MRGHLREARFLYVCLDFLVLAFRLPGKCQRAIRGFRIAVLSTYRCPDIAECGRRCAACRFDFFLRGNVSIDVLGQRSAIANLLFLRSMPFLPRFHPPNIPFLVCNVSKRPVVMRNRRTLTCLFASQGDPPLPPNQPPLLPLTRRSTLATQPTTLALAIRRLRSH